MAIEGRPQKIVHKGLEFTWSKHEEKGHVYICKTLDNHGVAIACSMNKDKCAWECLVLFAQDEGVIVYAIKESVNLSDAIDMAIMSFMNGIVNGTRARQALEMALDTGEKAPPSSEN